MDRRLVQFGNVFRHNLKEYVFLAHTDELLYAARILNSGETLQVQRMSDREERKTNSVLKNSAVLSFVVLRTEDFKNRAAYFAKTDHDEHQVPNLDIVSFLSKEDRLQIKEEICSPNTSLPAKLVELVRDLEIN